MHGPPLHEVPIITWIWMCGLSLLSGIATYLQRYQGGKKVRHPFLDLLYDTVYSLLAGFITFAICMASEIDIWYTIGFVSIGSHQGARLMFQMHILLHTTLKSLLQTMVNTVSDNDEKP